MFSSITQNRRILIRVDADFDGSGFRSLNKILDRIKITVESFLTKKTQVYLIAKRGRPVIQPRDSFVRIRANNPNLQFLELAKQISYFFGGNTEPPLIPMATVQIPAYEITNQLYFLENLAFDPREEANDQILARQLAALGDRYVIDDIRAMNDVTASIASISKAIPTQLSELVRREFSLLDRLINNPDRPLIAIIGGNQVSKKMNLIRKIGALTDELLIGGIIANTFLVSRGVDLQKSLIDAAEIDAAKQLGGLYEQKLTLPTDFIWRTNRVMDIGLQTRARFARAIESAGTILMAGPVGVTSPQLEQFKHGSLAIVEAVGRCRGNIKVALGDDTASFLNESKLENSFSFISTGDNAVIDYLSTGKLAALEAIKRSRFGIS